MEYVEVNPVLLSIMAVLSIMFVLVLLIFIYLELKEKIKDIYNRHLTQSVMKIFNQNQSFILSKSFYERKKDEKKGNDL